MLARVGGFVGPCLWVLAVAVLGCGNGNRPLPDIAALVQAAAGQRTVAARLTGGFPDGPCGEVGDNTSGAVVLPRCGKDFDPATHRELVGHRDRLRSVPRTEAAADILHASGVAELLVGGPDAAIRDLEEAGRRAPADAAIRSDLAAAYLTRAQASGDARDLVRSLGRSLEALRLDGGIDQALVNKALALDALGLSAATAAWHEVARRDRSKEWRAAARARVDRLGAQRLAWRWSRNELIGASRGGDQAAIRALVERFPQTARVAVEEELLPAWATAYLAGNIAEARGRLVEATLVANALRDTGRDSLLAEAVTQVGLLEAGPDRQQHAVLTSGLAAYGKGIAHYAGNRLDEALARFTFAREQLARVRSPLAAWATVHIANCHYRREEYSRAFAELEDVLRLPDADAHPALRGRALWILGVMRISLAEPADALRAYRRSLASFEAGREHDTAATVHALIADALDYIGEVGPAWQHRYIALRGMRALQNSRRRLAVLTDAANGALRLGEAEGALAIQEEAVRIAGASGNPLDLAESLRLRAAIESHCREQALTIASLRKAQQELRRLGEPRLERGVAGDMLFVEGRLHLRADPRRARELFQAATRAFEQTSFRARLAESLLSQAQASLAMGDGAGAEAALTSGISSIESEWQWTLAHRGEGVGDFGGAYTEQRRRLFEEMLRLLTDRGRIGLAFDYAERLHSWSLLDQALRLPVSARDIPALDSARPIGHRLLRQHLTPRTVVVEYALLQDRLVIWVVRPKSIQMQIHRAPRSVIDDGVRRLYVALDSADQTGVVERLTDLYSFLIAPVGGLLAPGDTLVFVPDRTLSAVPFSALRNGRTGRLLVEDFPIGVTPSAGLYRWATTRGRTLDDERPTRLLALGDPAFDPDSFPGLGRLPGAAAEAAAIAQLYPDARLLLGAGATRERLLDFAGVSTVVHVAAHVRHVEGSPLVSTIALSPSVQGSGVLYAHELLHRDFHRTRLFVLSACSSAQEIGDDRISGFVRPLLAAGVPSVIGTLWQIEDQAAGALMAKFHASYRRSGNPAAALREAQLTMIGESPGNSLRRVEVWGSFQAYGGTDEPR
jgi:CHAT domain-containing protein/tetratricopeptide (TPR) repeat protein